MAVNDLPFERGTTWDSGTYGAAPTGYLGQRFILDNGLELQLVKNANAAVVEGCELVKWTDPATGTVELADGNSEIELAGVVDPQYAVKGLNPPANSLFYIVKRGYTHCIAGDTITPDTRFMSDAGASAAVEGRIQVVSSAAILAGIPDVGFTHASANAGSSVAVQVNFA